MARSSSAIKSTAKIDSWCVRIDCDRATAEHIQFGEDGDSLPGAPVILARERIEDDPASWQIEAMYEEQPDDATVAALAALVPGCDAADLTVEPVAAQDWVAIGQSGLAPVDTGEFHVRNLPDQPVPSGRIAFYIPAGRAFGTGQHHTTTGCLMMLSRLARTGRRFRNIIDIGTGTGLLAFAAGALWPRAQLLATDIDPAAVETTADNADINGVTLGSGPGTLLLAAAPGVDHPLIAGLAPYDLAIANILAGPLIDLAPGIAAQVAPGGTLILAGLLDTQEHAVLSAYRRMGFTFVDRVVSDQWPTLRLRKRVDYGRARKRRWSRTVHGDAPGYGSW